MTTGDFLLTVRAVLEWSRDSTEHFEDSEAAEGWQEQSLGLQDLGSCANVALSGLWNLGSLSFLTCKMMVTVVSCFLLKIAEKFREDDTGQNTP